MNKRIIKAVLACVAFIAAANAMRAQQIFPSGNIFLNEEITTFIVSGENIEMVDISVMDTMVVGNQPGDNIVRLKAVKAFKNCERLGVVTIIGERSIAQYNLFYVASKDAATTEYRIRDKEMVGYLNPAVDMDAMTMYKYCWRIWGSERKFYDVTNSNNKMVIRLNNLYTAGGYFFLDISVENRSNIRFDIEEIRIKLCDKKQAKATSTQEIELKPVMDLMKKTKSFQKNYRSVFVLKRLTFPDEKVLQFTMSEKSISGRVISLKIDYADVLNADAFDNSL